MQHQERQDLTQNIAFMHDGADNKQQTSKFLERWMKSSNVDNE